MPKPAWHSTWHRMRRVGRSRPWMTWAEFDGLLRSVGITLSPYHVCRAVKVDPPVKAHGAKQYERRHLEMAADYARSRGLIGEGSLKW